MFKVGEPVSGYILDEQGKEVLVSGTFEFRTNDPEEVIQDIVIRLPNGKLQYIDEQDVRR